MDNDDNYHGYESESDYHEHHTLLALIEIENCEAARQVMRGRIDIILKRRVFVETRSIFYDHDQRRNPRRD